MSIASDIGRRLRPGESVPLVGLAAIAPAELPTSVPEKAVLLAAEVACLSEAARLVVQIPFNARQEAQSFAATIDDRLRRAMTSAAALASDQVAPAALYGVRWARPRQTGGRSFRADRPAPGRPDDHAARPGVGVAAGPASRRRRSRRPSSAMRRTSCAAIASAIPRLWAPAHLRFCCDAGGGADAADLALDRRQDARPVLSRDLCHDLSELSASFELACRDEFRALQSWDYATPVDGSDLWTGGRRPRSSSTASSGWSAGSTR